MARVVPAALLVLAGSLLAQAGCHPRYVVSGHEARRAVAELEARGEAVLRAHDEQHREVRVRVEADDGYQITRGRTVLEQFGVTDRGMLEGEERLVLDYDHPGGSLVFGGIALIIPGLIASFTAAALVDDWSLAPPVSGLAVAMDRSLHSDRYDECEGDVCQGLDGTWPATVSAILLFHQLAGIGMIIYAASIWNHGREVEPAAEQSASLTVVPLVGPDGTVGGALGFSFW